MDSFEHFVLRQSKKTPRTYHEAYGHTDAIEKGHNFSKLVLNILIFMVALSSVLILFGD
jgi:hypothetical protein